MPVLLDPSGFSRGSFASLLRRRLDLATGVHTRSTEGSYYGFAVSGDPSSHRLYYAPANVLRWDDRNDGYGQMLLFEGSRQNLIPEPRNIMGAGWSAGGTSTLNIADGPDATSSADLNSCISGGFGNYVSFSLSIGVRYTSSFFARRQTGAGVDEAHFAIQDGTSPGVGTYSSAAITEAWARYQVSRTLTNAACYHVPLEGRTTGGLTARALSYLVDLHQFEQGAFASSPMRTGMTRAADRLTFAVGTYPSSFLDDGFEIEFAPDFLPSEMHSTGAGFMLLGVSGNASSLQGLYLSYNIPGDPARLFVNNLGSYSDPFSWTVRGQKMRAKVSPRRGTITIEGATTGNGMTTLTPWTITPGILDIGQRATGSSSNVWFGRLGRYIWAL